MATKKHGISHDLLIHPGETISDILADRNLTQEELAMRAGVTVPFLRDVIKGKRDISKDFAMGLEYALGVSGAFWLNLQANYDAELLSLQEDTSVQPEEKTVISAIREVVDYLKKASKIPRGLTQEQTIIHLRKYFRLSELTGLCELVPSGAFRISEKATVNPYVLGAWLCLCKAQAEGKRAWGSFNVLKIGQLVEELKKIMRSNGSSLQKTLVALFAQYGIVFSIVHNFRGAPVQGYIERRDDGSYQIAMTIRGAFADIFWFSLFHELGHIANGDLSKPGSFIDADSGETDISARETAADKFARDALLDSKSYASFVERGQFSLLAIKSYSRTQNVPPFIVIGRLQKDKVIPWSRFTKEKPRYKWIE